MLMQYVSMVSRPYSRCQSAVSEKSVSTRVARLRKTLGVEVDNGFVLQDGVGEQFDPFVLAHRIVVEPLPSQRLRDCRGVILPMVAQVERGEREPKGFDAAAKRVHFRLDDAFCAVGSEAVGDGVHVREQFLGVLVAAGANVADTVDSLAHQREFLAVRFLRVAFGRTLCDRGELLAVGIERANRTPDSSPRGRRPDSGLLKGVSVRRGSVPVRLRAAVRASRPSLPA